MLLFPPGLQNSCSPPSLIFPHPKPRSFLPPLIHSKPTSFKFLAFFPESPCRVHLVYPLHPTPSLHLPQISSCLCSPLFCPSLSHPSCLLLPLFMFGVSSHTSLDITCKKTQKLNDIIGHVVRQPLFVLFFLT